MSCSTSRTARPAPCSTSRRVRSNRFSIALSRRCRSNCRKTRDMLEAGIVGLPAASKTMLFNVLTRAGVGPDFGKEHVGMAPIADERLDQIAEVLSAAEGTPAGPRVVDVPGTGPQLLGNLRQVDALLAVTDGFSAGADPDGDLERLDLELLVADRDHVEQRRQRVTQQAEAGRTKQSAGGRAIER